MGLASGGISKLVKGKVFLSLELPESSMAVGTFFSPLEGSFCLSLACYPVDSVAPLMSTATEKQPFDALIMQARIKSTWPSDPGFRSTLKDGSGKSYAIPPFLVSIDPHSLSCLCPPTCRQTVILLLFSQCPTDNQR